MTKTSPDQIKAELLRRDKRQKLIEELAVEYIAEDASAYEYLDAAKKLDSSARIIAVKGGVACQYRHLRDRIKDDQKALEDFEERVGEQYDLAALRDGELVPARRIVN
ncbi:hypothetical protein LCM08_26510 [Salipiger pacificus]|nr:hypothetical protein [Alloyangia pacifica]